MLNRLTLTPGDIVRYRDRDRGDMMSYYVFREWSGVPQSPRGGRIAILTWCWNGRDASSWEADITWAGPVDRDMLALMIEAEHRKNPSNAAVPCVQ